MARKISTRLTHLLLLALTVLALLGAATFGATVQKGAATPLSLRWKSQWRELRPQEKVRTLSQGNFGYFRGYVALKERSEGLKAVQAAVEAASDPRNPRYGHHLTMEQVHELVAPEEVDVQRVVEWLEMAGAEKVEVVRPSRSWIRFTAHSSVMSAMVSCQLRYFTPTEPQKNGKTKVIQRCADGAYSVPAHLDDIIEFITPLVGFPRPSGRRTLIKTDVPRDTPNVVPELLRKLYNIPAPENSGVNNSQAVFETEDSYSYKDLTYFLETYQPELQGQRVLGTLGNMGNDPTSPDTEASLDIQYIMAVGAFAPSYSYNYKDEDGDEIKVFLDYVTDIANDPHPPLVHSISYGEYGGNYDIGEVMRVSNEWMKLGARGLTFLVASGDDGVGCSWDCQSFEFPYPSSPWITLVGSTQVHQSTHGVFSEIGSTFSSGGFSNDFGIPSWQASQVAYYLKNSPNLPASSYFNSSGRALPDVSAAGENVQVIVNLSPEAVEGTSCSAPIIGGMVSLWNAMRLKAGKSPMGFINPFLYQASSNPSAFYDVTSGNNADGCCPGFNAFKGWDPVTGLGTPNFKFLADLVAKLP